MKVVCRTDEYKPEVREIRLPADAIQLQEVNLPQTSRPPGRERP